MTCTFEKNGYIDFRTMARDIAKVMVDNGFSVLYPDLTSGAQVDKNTFKFTLKATTAVDSLADTQPWCIQIDATDNTGPQDPGCIRVCVATPIQLDKTGRAALEYPGTSTAGTGNLRYPTVPSTNGIKKFPRKSGELTCGYYKWPELNTFLGSGIEGNPNKTLAPNPDNELSIPFVSKRWFKQEFSIIEFNPTAIPQDPLDDSFTAVGSDIESNPYSFRITLSDHGVALVVWEEGADIYGDRFSWFVVQRPVDNATGKTLINSTPNSRCPVFCVYSIGGGHPTNSCMVDEETIASSSNLYRTVPMLRPVPDLFTAALGKYLSDTKSTGMGTAQPYSIINETNYADDVHHYDVEPYFNATAIYRFTVREIDINRPTVPVIATMDTPDYRAIINGKQQVSISENNQYIINFISGINTARYLYKHELDLLTYSSADVVSMWSDVELQPYTFNNIPQTIKYRAMHANLPNNAGMRILLAVEASYIGTTYTFTPFPVVG